jgi:hypothetical protein
MHLDEAFYLGYPTYWLVALHLLLSILYKGTTDRDLNGTYFTPKMWIFPSLTLITLA